VRRCFYCGNRAFRQATETVRAHLRASRVHASAVVPVRQCAKCQESYFSGPVLHAFELAVALELANSGVRTGEAFRHMRVAVGLRAADVARLLGVTPETISHWETGKAAVNRAAFVTLGAMVDDEIEGRTTTRDRLDRLAKGRPYPKVLRPRLSKVG